ncbi:MAG: Crp/Fnr family transcriptional regulator [Gemmatimonadaceae bacterium]|nr:Crp/Fnr family transcriptional regulator [Gloeobacterales cyanobacterium ES-bin-141]
MLERLLDLDALPEPLQTVTDYREFAPGQVIFRQDEPAASVYFVRVGQVRVVRHTRTGQTVLLYRVTAGQPLAEILTSNRFYTCESIAEKTTHILSFPKVTLLSTLQSDAQLASVFIKHLAGRIELLQRQLALRDIVPARERVLEFLLQVLPPGERSIALDRSLKEIATELSLTQETLYRVLARLERDGTIYRHRRTITMLNRSA